MKKLSVVICILFLCISSYAQDYYYYFDEKIPIVKIEDMVYLKITNDFIEHEFKILEKNGFKIHYYDETRKEMILKANNMDLNEKNILIKCKNIIAINPFYSTIDGKYKIGVTETFVVKLKSNTDYSLLNKLILETNTHIIEQDKWDTNRVIIAVDKHSKGNSLQMANYFFEFGIFEYSVPDFFSNLSLETVDEFWNEQWPLENNGQNGGSVGADINIGPTWQITKGDNVKIAVLDVGVDLTHPDLIHNLLQGYDATGNGSNGAPTNVESHGTACAGIIAAQANNTIGISGVAPNSKIIPVRMAPDEYNYFSQDIVNAIRWSWQNGADILSFSWGVTPNPDITTEINNALTYGRNGLGCVILCSSGNGHNGTLNFPASLSGTIAVGASSNKDYRESYSNYGTRLDVVAPGGYYNITTTDYVGDWGYDQSDYVHTFCGTSAACPHAAGVAALMLSVNPCMTSSDVHEKLCKSCIHVRNSNYVYNNSEY